MSDPDKKRGLYRKYFVRRLPDELPDYEPTAKLGMTLVCGPIGYPSEMWDEVVGPEKHRECPYFVLDPVHDAFARWALTEYARACRAEYPGLADGIEKLLDDTKHAFRKAGWPDEVA